jgi:hypothetical protein
MAASPSSVPVRYADDAAASPANDEAPTRVEPLMYPHALDRYRALQLILRRIRVEYRCGPDEPGVGQKWVALRARVGQPTVSNLENIAESLDSPKRHVGREELLKVLTWGFELPPERVDALLWLYDGCPLSPAEFRAYVRGYSPRSAPCAMSASELRALVLAELRHFVERDTPDVIDEVSRVRLFSGTPHGRLELARANAAQECMSGQRLLIRAELSLRYHRWPKGVDHATDPRIGLETDCHMESIGRRVALGLMQTVERYGERSIHSIAAVQRYLDPAVEHPTSIDERRHRVEQLLAVLRDYPLYEIAFTDAVPRLDLIAKHLCVAATVSLASSAETLPGSDWGPASIQFWDTRTVVWFGLLFEEQWDAIAPQWKSREHVIEWLETLVGRARC